MHALRRCALSTLCHESSQISAKVLLVHHGAEAEGALRQVTERKFLEPLAQLIGGVTVARTVREALRKAGLGSDIIFDPNANPRHQAGRLDSETLLPTSLSFLRVHMRMMSSGADPGQVHAACHPPVRMCW